MCQKIYHSTALQKQAEHSNLTTEKLKTLPADFDRSMESAENFLGNPPILLTTTAVAYIIMRLIFNKYWKANKVQLLKSIMTDLSHLF